MRDSSPLFEKEKPFGSTEFKIKLTNLNQKRIEELATQLHYRLNEETYGEAIYELGVTDDGEPLGLNERDLNESLVSLEKIAELVNAKCSVMRLFTGRKGKIAEILIRRKPYEVDFPININVALVGNVDSGKSTFIGVVISDELDDGRGKSRAKVFRHLHEFKSGRTSSISNKILGFDAIGRITNYHNELPRSNIEIINQSAKIISFIDLAGHEKYLKTTIFGLTSWPHDYVMCFVPANAGVKGTTREHMGLSFALRLPIFVVLTKIDLVPEEITNNTLNEIQHILKMPGVSKIPVIIRNLDDVVVSVRYIQSARIVPIFLISNVTGKGIELLKHFLNLLPKRTNWKDKVNQRFLMYVDEIFNVKGIGTIVSGTILQGNAKINDVIRIGPFDNGEFRPTRIRSIHYKRVPVQAVHAGQSCTFALHQIKHDEIRKGMVLTNDWPKIEEKVKRVFKAHILVLHHPTTIRRGYQPLIHIQTVRQSAEIIEMSEEPLRSGEKADVTFRFLYRPEIISSGQKLIFREGATRGIGVVS